MTAARPSRRRLGWCVLVLGLLFFVATPRAHGQRPETALSDAEIEKLRDTAFEPAERVLAFAEFLDSRSKQIDKLNTGKRQPGREEDLHDALEQFTSITNDLMDNLEDYKDRHRDLRKVLPKLLAATERWTSALKAPPEAPAYSVARKLALESLADVHSLALELVGSQKEYFRVHPPAKDANRDARH